MYQKPFTGYHHLGEHIIFTKPPPPSYIPPLITKFPDTTHPSTTPPTRPYNPDSYNLYMHTPQHKPSYKLERKPLPRTSTILMQEPKPYIDSHSSWTSFDSHKTAISLHSIGTSSALVDCPICEKQSLTRTKTQKSLNGPLEISTNNQDTWSSWTWTSSLKTWFCLCFTPSLPIQPGAVQHRCGACNSHLVNWYQTGKVEIIALR